MTDQNTTQTTPVAVSSRPKQNGQTRPTPGTLTGLVWDYADALLAKNAQLGTEHVVPTIGEVKDLYKQVQGAQDSTAATQYGRWLKFHGLQDALKLRRAADKATKPGAAEKEAEKAAKKQAREDAKAAKAQEKADKKAAKEAEKEAKAAEKQAAREAKEAEKRAKAEAAAEEAKAKAEAAAKAAAEKAEAAAKAAADAAANAG
jgi:hypothetical protein